MVWRRVAAAVIAVFALLVVPAAPAFARNVCQNAPSISSSDKITAVPVEDQMYAPKALSALATGAGVRVGVIDSGVDGSIPQLRGQVVAGMDFLHGDPDAQQDCVGHGTAVASIIAAKPSADTGFQGLAPGATIVPVRVTEQEQDFEGDTTGDHVGFPELAAAIDWAVGAGHCQVLNLSLVAVTDDPAVRGAVARAVDAGVVVVAAAGNLTDNTADTKTKSFPADYPGVLGVAAVTSDGVRASFSKSGPWVGIAAPGGQVTVATLGGGQATEDGTSFATPYVAATAALIKQRYPQASGQEIIQRIEATADPSPGSGSVDPSAAAGGADAGARNNDYGFGILNPYRALTDSLAFGAAPLQGAAKMTVRDPAATALAARRAHSQRMALIFAAVGAGLVGLITAVAIVARRGRRRGWQPATPGAGTEPLESATSRH